MSASKLSVRVNPANPNHHLWNNNGTWFIHYTRHETGYTKRRVRHSLKTRRVSVARNRRDAVLAEGRTSPPPVGQSASEIQSFVQ